MSEKKELVDSNGHVELTVRSKIAKGRPVQGEDYGAEIKFSRAFGGNLAGAIEEFGEPVVYSYFIQQCKTRAGSLVRVAMEAQDDNGVFQYTDDQCTKMGLDFVPGAKTTVPKAPSARELALQEIEAVAASGEQPDVPAIFEKYGIALG